MTFISDYSASLCLTWRSSRWGRWLLQDIGHICLRRLRLYRCSVPSCHRTSRQNLEVKQHVHNHSQFTEQLVFVSSETGKVSPVGLQRQGVQPGPAPCRKKPSLQRSQWRPSVFPWQSTQCRPQASRRQYRDLPLQRQRSVAAGGNRKSVSA